MRRIVIIWLSLAVAASSAAERNYRAYSSCSVSAGDRDWVKAKPYTLKSWLGSIVPGMRHYEGELRYSAKK